MPLFSVIIPTFNRAAMCRAAVDSVLQQEFADFEIIVVDDGSTDSTEQALSHYGGRIRFLRQENSGQSVARNAAIVCATGEYVAFLDSDDQWFPWTLATLERAIRQGNKPAIVAGKSVPFWQRAPVPESIDQSFSIGRFDDALDFFARSGPVILETGVLVIRTDALRAAGGFAPTRDNSEDVDLCLRLCTAPGFVRLLSPPLFAKLNHASNTGLQLERSASGLKEIYRRERAGIYPGGAGRKRTRLAIILLASRETMFHAVHIGNAWLALSLYWRCLAWNLRLGKLKFILKLPALALTGFWRKH